MMLAYSCLAVVLSTLMLLGPIRAQDVQRARSAPPPKGDLTLGYRQPAKKWSEALSVGNGRLGAMIFGGVTEGRIQFNEDSLWTGQPEDYFHEGAAEHLPALPTAWPKGSVTGLCARAAFEVAIDWADGKLQGATILSKRGNSCTVRYGNRTVKFETKPDQKLRLDGELRVQSD